MYVWLCVRVCVTAVACGSEGVSGAILAGILFDTGLHRFWCCPAVFARLTGLQALHRKALGLQMLSHHVQILYGLWELTQVLILVRQTFLAREPLPQPKPRQP